MEQTALRPKPMPGHDPGQDSGRDSGRDAGPHPGQDPCHGPGKHPGDGAPGMPGTPEAPAPRPHAARRRARRLRTALFALLTGTLLVLSGVGLGTVGVTAIGMERLADLRRHAVPSDNPADAGAVRRTPSPHPAPATASLAPASPAATLGLEAVDAEKSGALVVGVHVPGPGYTAGLVRGDVVLALDRTRVGSAADLARAVADADPGTRVTLSVRHRSGGYQQLTAVPGVVT